MPKQPLKNILENIGNTPLIELEPGIYAKCEYFNPSGSIKARMALYMVEQAEKEGLLKPGYTIVESTSGNTGNALSMIAKVTSTAEAQKLIKEYETLWLSGTTV